MTATFSVHARVSGLDPLAIGTLTGAAGLLQIGAAIPIGLLSDRIGRRRLIFAGHAAFAVSMAYMAFAGRFLPLLLGRLLFTLGSTAIFQVGSARLGDIVVSRLRHCAFGLLSATMGLGFGIGPFLGGLLSDTLGHALTYLLASSLSLSALFVVQFCVGQGSRPRASYGMCQGLRRGFADMARSPDLLLVTFANMIAGVTFAGTLGTFLPLYGRDIRISQTAIGTMFAVRSCVSAFGRLPASILARRFGNHTFLLLGLACDSAAMFGIWAANRPSVILVMLVVEGLAYGGFIVAGQTYVATHTTDENRGTVGGIYAMASGTAATFAPFALGVVAERWDVRSVFAASGVIVAAGFAAFATGLWLVNLRPRQAPVLGQ